MIERCDMRDRIASDARGYLNRTKERLQAMSYYTACADPMADYFDIDSETDDYGFMDDTPFKVKFTKGATATLQQDAGRFLFFSTEKLPSDAELIRQCWQDEDIFWQYNTFMNQGETTDITDEFFDGVAGRDLPLFLASMFREWVCDHMFEEFHDTWDVDDFMDEARRWWCTVDSSGALQAEPLKDKMKTYLRYFGVTRKDIMKYFSEAIHQENYFASEYGG